MSTEKGTEPTTRDEESAADAGKTGYRAILEREIQGGIRELARKWSGLLISSVSAGLDVGFGPLLMVAIATIAAPDTESMSARLLMAAAYGIGFVFVIVGRSELFTEHTTMAVLPVLARRAGWLSLFRLWGLVYVGNIVGAFLFALLTTQIVVAVGAGTTAAYVEVAESLLAPQWWVIAGGAVLAGWLMGLLSWLAAATRDTIGLIVTVWIVTGSIGLLGLHHSIAGSVEVLSGVFAGGVGFDEYLRFLIWATLGNIVGGTVFVALLKFGHVVRSSREDDPDVEAEMMPDG